MFINRLWRNRMKVRHTFNLTRGNLFINRILYYFFQSESVDINELKANSWSREGSFQLVDPVRREVPKEARPFTLSLNC
jgi:hypothetical protein